MLQDTHQSEIEMRIRARFNQSGTSRLLISPEQYESLSEEEQNAIPGIRHDARPIIEHFRKIRRTETRGCIFKRGRTYYFYINTLDGREITPRAVRIGRNPVVRTREQAEAMADGLFAEYLKTGIIPNSAATKPPRDTKRIAGSGRREFYVLKYQEQEGKCAICQKDYTHLFIDHNHKTGKLRALLCVRCNSGIGQLLEDPAMLRKAAEYLEAHNVEL